MSQMTLPVRSLTGRLSAPSAQVRRGRTRVMDALPADGNPAFRLLCLALVLCTAIGVLLLNTARAEGSYVQANLEREATELRDTRLTLEAEVAERESSESLARAARKLDMVPAPSTATLRLSDGSITGVASMVDGERTISVDLPATGVAVDD